MTIFPAKGRCIPAYFEDSFKHYNAISLVSSYARLSPIDTGRYRSTSQSSRNEITFKLITLVYQYDLSNKDQI